MTTTDEVSRSPLLGDGFEMFPIVLSQYAEQSELSAAELEAEEIGGLLGRYGGVVRPWTVPPGGRDFAATSSWLNEWATTARSSSVLLWLGHGQTLRGGPRLLVPLSDAVDHLVTPDNLTDKIVDLVKRREESRWTVVVIEACGAGAFVDEVWAGLKQQRRTSGVLLIGSGAAGGNGYLGNFRRTLRSVCHGYEQARFTSHDREISLADFAARFKEQLSHSDTVECGQVAGIDPVFMRRRRIPPLTAPVDVFARMRREFELLPPEEQAHMPTPVALGELGGRLSGRSAEAEQIEDFLRAAVCGLLVVTGPAGCGKSTLLSSILLGANQEVARRLARLGLATSASGERIAVSGSLLLTGASLHEVTGHVSDVAGVTLSAGALNANESAAELLAAVARRDSPLILVADSLDESADPRATAALLRELCRTGRACVVVGTRRHPATGRKERTEDLLADLGAPPSRVLELEHDGAAVAASVRDRLLADPRFRAARGLGAQADAAAIAEEICFRPRAGQVPGDFLLARLIVEEFLAEPGMPLDTERFRQLLDMDHERGFVTALRRITARCAPADACLRALALSGGRGVPRAGSVWATMAQALIGKHGPDITEQRLDEVLDEAAAYIMLDYVDGQSVYRLAHQAFRDHFTANPEPGQDELVARAVLRLATGQDDLGSYLRRHLPAHLARLGSVGWKLLGEQPEVLDRLDLPPLVTAAQAAPEGLSSLPLNVLGAVVTSHLSAVSTPADRSGLRQLGTARVSGSLSRWAVSAAPAGAWTATWAALRRQRIHLTLSGHRGSVSGLAIANGPADRRLLASAGEDGTVRLWDPGSGWRMRSDLLAHSGPVLGLAAVTLPPGMSLLASVGAQDPLRIFEAMTGRQIAVLADEQAGEYSAMISFRAPGRGAALAVADDHGGIRVLSAASLSPVGTRMTGHYGRITGLVTVAMPDGRILIATGGRDGSVRLWDPVRSAQVGATMHEPESPVTSLSVIVTLVGQQLVTGHENGDICCWDPHRSALSGHLRTGKADLVVAALPDAGSGRLVAAGGSDGVVRVWNLDTGQPIGPDGSGHQGPVAHVLSLAGAGLDGRFATGGRDGAIRIWEVGSPAGDPPGRPGGPVRVARPPAAGGRWRSAPSEPEWQVTADADGALTYNGPVRMQPLSSAASARQSRRILGLGASVRAVLVITTPAGGHLMATAADATIRLWDIDGHRPYGIPLSGHDGWIRAMTMAGDCDGSPMLLSGGDDGTLRAWDWLQCRARHVVRLGSRVHGLSTDGREIIASLDDGKIAVRLYSDHFVQP